MDNQTSPVQSSVSSGNDPKLENDAVAQNQPNCLDTVNNAVEQKIPENNIVKPIEASTDTSSETTAQSPISDGSGSISDGHPSDGVDNEAIENKIDSSLNLENGDVIEADSTKPEVVSGSVVDASMSRGSLIKNIIIGVIVVVVILMIWVWVGNSKNDNKVGLDNRDNKVNVTVSDKKEGGSVNIVNSTGTTISDRNLANAEAFGDKAKITAYYGNSMYNKNSADCALVFPLQRFADNKYDSDIINTVRGLLDPLSDEEKAQGYYSAIPAGTFLKNVMIKGNGEAEVSFSGSIGKMGGSCAVSSVRSQIVKTLMQFPEVKSVTICIDGNCNQGQILQP